MNTRDTTKKITVGGLEIGGGAPVTVQSMCNTKTWDVEKTVQQIKDFRAAGCDIVRIAIPDMRAAEAVPAIKEQVDMPLVHSLEVDFLNILVKVQLVYKSLLKILKEKYQKQLKNQDILHQLLNVKVYIKKIQTI